MTNTSLNASSNLMKQAATERGLSCTTFGDNETILMQHERGHWYTRGSRISFQSSVGFTIARLKHLTKAVLLHHDLPTAPAVEVRKTEDLDAVSQLTFPVVMKPIAGQHGKRVVVGVKDIAEAAKHFEKYQEPVLFEEMLTGTEYRVVCVGFEFEAAAYRKPAFVTGDGQHTIQELIEAKNQHPWRGKGHTSPLTVISVDDLVEAYLEEQGYDLASTPEKDTEVFLRKTNNLSTGGEPHDVTELVHPDNKQLFSEIARACDLCVIGIDFMCQDLSKPITNQNGAGVIEVNASPGLRMHHYPILGEQRDVAGAIIEYCLDQL